MSITSHHIIISHHGHHIISWWWWPSHHITKLLHHPLWIRRLPSYADRRHSGGDSLVPISKLQSTKLLNHHWMGRFCSDWSVAPWSVRRISFFSRFVHCRRSSNPTHFIQYIQYAGAYTLTSNPFCCAFYGDVWLVARFRILCRVKITRSLCL